MAVGLSAGLELGVVSFWCLRQLYRGKDATFKLSVFLYCNLGDFLVLVLMLMIWVQSIT